MLGREAAKDEGLFRRSTRRRGALGHTKNRKTQEKNFIQNRKTANKISQIRKPHKKLSKPDTVATREAYGAKYTNTNFIKVFVNDKDFSEAFVNMFSHLLKSQALFLPLSRAQTDLPKNRLIFRNAAGNGA